MMKALLTYLSATVLCTGLAFAGTVDGEDTYNLLFKNGTLDEIDRDSALLYTREVVNVLKPDAETRDTGDIALSFRTEGKDVAQLQFRQDQKHRSLGTFPASVGNPMIMFFYETVIRDMAEAAGGSPFYIRNRVKESLVEPSDIVEGEAVIDGKTVATQTIRMQPFLDDPNAEQMQGFGNLELTVTMSDAVPGWYLTLVAEAGSSDAPVYRSQLQFDRIESGQ